MEQIKSYLIAGLTITCMILLLLVRGCDKDKVDNTSSYMKPDSIIYRVDTIKLKDTLIRYKPIYYPKEIVKWKTNTSDSLISKESNEYMDSVKSNDVIISYKAITLGKLISLDLSSKLINRKEVLITKDITHEKLVFLPPKFSISGGLSLKGGKSSLDVSPFLKIDLKKKTVLISYDILKQEYGLGIGIKLFSSKN